MPTLVIVVLDTKLCKISFDRQCEYVLKTKRVLGLSCDMLAERELENAKDAFLACEFAFGSELDPVQIRANNRLERQPLAIRNLTVMDH